MKLPKGTTVHVGGQTYKGEIPDSVVEAHKLKIPGEKKPEPPKRPATHGSASSK